MQTDREMQDLDALLDLARQHRAEPSEALMARVLADALAEQPQAPPVVARRAEGRGLLGWIMDHGGGMFAGLGTAAAAGLLVGYAAPATVTDLTASLLPGSQIESVDLMPSLGGWLDEE